MADNPSNIVPDNIIVVEGDAGFVPKAEPSDAGKVLKVDSQGTPVWGEDSGGTSFEPDKGLELTGGKLSVKTYYGLTNNMNGEGLVGIVPGDSTLSVNSSGIRVTNPLPTSTSSDSGKVLKVDSQGAPVWGNAPAGIVEFDWDTVTLSDIEGAITAGKTPVMLYIPWDNTYTTKCYLQKIEHTGSGDNYIFVSTPEGFVDTPSDQSTSITVLIMMYDGSKGSNVRLVSAILSSSDGSVTMAQGATSAYLDLSVANPLPASTSADADKVLTVNSSGTPVWAAAQGGGGGGSAVYGKRVVNADPTYSEVSPLSPIISSQHIYYTLADSSETRQIAALLIPSFGVEFRNWSDSIKILNNENGSPASNAISLSLGKYNASTGTYTTIDSVAYNLGVSANTSDSYFSVRATDILYIPSSPLPVLSEGETYVISMYSTVGGFGSDTIYPSSLNSLQKVQVYFSSTTSKVCFERTPRDTVIAPLYRNGDSTIYLNPDYSKGFCLGDGNDTYGRLTVRTSDVGRNLGHDPQNPEGYLQYVSLKEVENNNSGWQDQKPRFPGHRAYLESSNPSIANPSSYNVGSRWALNQGNRGNVYIVHFEIPMTSSGNADVNCICKFYLQDREEDWETMQQTMHYHYYTLIGQYIASEQIAVFDGAITIPETKGMPDNNYWSPTVTPLDSGTTLTVDSTRSPRYCWSFI